MPVINKISLEGADELQEETVRPYPKDSPLEDAEGQVIYVKTIEEFRRLTEKLESLRIDSEGFKWLSSLV